MQEKLTSEEIYQGHLINLRVQTMSQASAGTNRFEIVEHPGGVAIVALRNEQVNGNSMEPEVVLVCQNRPAIGREIWEIPAGVVEANERDVLERAAARELYEETGCIADSWQCLVREYPSPGFSTERITIYLAQQVHVASDGPVDATEITKVHWIPLSKALAWCRNGKIEDGKTLLGLLYLALHNNQLHIDARKKKHNTVRVAAYPHQQ